MLYKIITTYILIASIFFACKNPFTPKNPLKISTEVLDTVKSVPARINATPVLFETAFIKGTTQKGNTANINLFGVTIGKLKVVSGHIIACDPLHIDEYGKPFTQLFPTGEFPVQLSIAEVGGEETVAFARINFSDEPVARWEMALLKEQEPLPVGGEKIHGYGVDAGIGIFMDEEGIKVMSPEQLTAVEEGIYRDIRKEMDNHYHNDWKYTMFNFNKLNLAAFTTGVGDGRYATYIGFDTSGKPCRLVTDFKLFNWKESKK
jgi:hypothetical protein